MHKNSCYAFYSGKNILQNYRMHKISKSYQSYDVIWYAYAVAFLQGAVHGVAMEAIRVGRKLNGRDSDLFPPFSSSSLYISPPFFPSLLQFANRIAKAKFTQNLVSYC